MIISKVFTTDVKYIILTLLMHIVIGLFTAKHYLAFEFSIMPGCLIFRKQIIARKPENNSLGSVVLVKMPNLSGSYPELRGLTLDL